MFRFSIVLVLSFQMLVPTGAIARLLFSAGRSRHKREERWRHLSLHQ